MRLRAIDRLIHAVETSDGAGVRIKRSIGRTDQDRLDPFLMLDEFGSDSADDYIAGFPAHPHRGFETVTYMLDGHMLHEDHLGNRGHLASGDVQWMTAGRGIVHSEMPQQESGLMRGFQLWVNLPAHEKMCEPHYRDIPGAEIPHMQITGGTVLVIAGEVGTEGEHPDSKVTGVVAPRSTEPVYLDIHLDAGAGFRLPLARYLNGLVYAYNGNLEVEGPDSEYQTLGVGTAAVLGPGDEVSLRAGSGPARCLLLAGRPLEEPVVQYGPFVMNTDQEIQEAIRDYQNGSLAQPANRQG